MSYTYKTRGVCAAYIDVEMDRNILKDVQFHGGCHGNLQGISSLVKGMSYEQIKEKLDGIRCGYKSTSCPDQLVIAIAEAMANR